MLWFKPFCILINTIETKSAFTKYGGNKAKYPKTVHIINIMSFLGIKVCFWFKPFFPFFLQFNQRKQNQIYFHKIYVRMIKTDLFLIWLWTLRDVTCVFLVSEIIAQQLVQV